MSKRNKACILAGCGLIVAFALWTLLVRYVDVKPIGPMGSRVGFATLNGFVNGLFGVHMWLYTVTDWLGLVPIFVCLCFAVFGAWQLIKTRSIFKVDGDILLLGAYYIVVIAVYIFFEYVIINYRPVLINGYLEASYPSSTTLLVMCVMPTAVMMLKPRVRNKGKMRALCFVDYLFVAFMVIGRLCSGVHWLSDIIGGALFSGGACLVFYGIRRFAIEKFLH